MELDVTGARALAGPVRIGWHRPRAGATERREVAARPGRPALAPADAGVGIGERERGLRLRPGGRDVSCRKDPGAACCWSRERRCGPRRAGTWGFYFDSDAAAVPMIVVSPTGMSWWRSCSSSASAAGGPWRPPCSWRRWPLPEGRTELGEQLYREALKDAPVQGSLGRGALELRLGPAASGPSPPGAMAGRCRWFAEQAGLVATDLCAGAVAGRAEAGGGAVVCRRGASRRNGATAAAMRSCCRCGETTSVPRWRKCGRRGRPRRRLARVGAAGLAPASSRNSSSGQSAGGMAGWCGLAGRRKPRSAARPTAGGWAFGRCEAVLRAKQCFASKAPPMGLDGALLVCSPAHTANRAS